jgi:hypothetical protein
MGDGEDFIILLKEGFVDILECAWWNFEVTNWTAASSLACDAVAQQPIDIKNIRILFETSVADIMIAYQPPD